jgi:hypothetical protein
MATTKITDLTAYTDPVNTDVLPIVDVTSDVTKKVSIANVMKNASLGTAALPGIAFDGDPNTGIYSPAADQVAVTTGGTARLTASTTALTSTLAVDVPLGAQGTPSLTFTGDLNTGIYSPGADQVAISTNGTGRLFVGASGDVGVGVAAPANPVDVLGSSGGAVVFNGRGRTSDNIGVIRMASSDSVTEYFRIQTASASSFVGTTGSTPLIFNTNGLERMRLDSSGRLGVGTSSPGNKLAVIGTTGALADSSIRINGTAGTQSANSGLWITGNQTTSHHNWLIGSQYNVNNGFEITPSTAVDGATFSTPALVVTSAGRVGIGTTSPSTALHVAGTELRVESTTSASGFVRFLNTSGSMSIGMSGAATNTLLIYDRTNSQSAYTYDGGASGSHVWYQNGTERARIDSSGRLLVGTSSARTNFYNQASTYTPKVQIESATGSSGDTMAAIISSNAGGFGGYLLLAHQRSGTIGGNTILNNADVVGSVSFQGSDGNEFVECATIEAYVDGIPGANDMPGRLVFSTTADGASSPAERMRIRNDGSILIQQTALSSASDGCYFNANTPANFHQLLCHSTATSSLANLYLNRQGSDGTLIDFRQADTTEGSVSVSGTTVSFNGGHLSRWSQLPNEEDPSSILKGTVMSNLDEMCEWGEEDNEQLNKTKVSDVEGDPNVAGVFVATSFSEDGPLDFYLAMTGDMIIRIAEGVTVQRGQLLMSAGDGTAKPQGDGFVQDKTIAKVTSTHVTCTYDDGSYCVPCVLMAC